MNLKELTRIRQRCFERTVDELDALSFDPNPTALLGNRSLTNTLAVVGVPLAAFDNAWSQLSVRDPAEQFMQRLAFDLSFFEIKDTPRLRPIDGEDRNRVLLRQVARSLIDPYHARSVALDQERSVQTHKRLSGALLELEELGLVDSIDEDVSTSMCIAFDAFQIGWDEAFAWRKTNTLTTARTQGVTHTRLAPISFMSWVLSREGFDERESEPHTASEREGPSNSSDAIDPQPHTFVADQLHQLSRLLSEDVSQVPLSAVNMTDIADGRETPFSIGVSNVPSLWGGRDSDVRFALSEAVAGTLLDRSKRQNEHLFKELFADLGLSPSLAEEVKRLAEVWSMNALGDHALISESVSVAANRMRVWGEVMASTADSSRDQVTLMRRQELMEWTQLIIDLGALYGISWEEERESPAVLAEFISMLLSGVLSLSFVWPEKIRDFTAVSAMDSRYGSCTGLGLAMLSIFESVAFPLRGNSPLLDTQAKCTESKPFMMPVDSLDNSSKSKGLIPPEAAVNDPWAPTDQSFEDGWMDAWPSLSIPERVRIAKGFPERIVVILGMGDRSPDVRAAALLNPVTTISDWINFCDDDHSYVRLVALHLIFTSES